MMYCIGFFRIQNTVFIFICIYMQRPWNKANEVIYSLVTKDQDKNQNMNICTYVVPISMKPKKYMIALDPTTKTYQNFLHSDHAVLQILSES